MYNLFENTYLKKQTSVAASKYKICDTVRKTM